MSRPKFDDPGYWFEPEPCRSSDVAIAALNKEARRRKLSYGQLVAETSALERFEIVEAYRRSQHHAKGERS